MAQSVVIEHLGSITCTKGQAYTTASFLTLFPTATTVLMATENVSCSINATPMFLTQSGQDTYLATGKTYVFDKDCILVFGTYRSI